MNYGRGGRIIQKNILGIGIIFLFFGLIIFSRVESIRIEKYILANNEIIKTNTENYLEYQDGLEYWGLLIGVGIYAGYPGEDIPSNLSAEAMYNSLLKSEHWQEDHLKIITKEKATKKNIIEGFSWLENNEDEDDISVVYIATHGGRLKFFDIPIDLSPIDEADHCDEFLVTYYGFKKPFLENLRDDELNSLLNRLESQGICVIIDCCYAGGFNDTSNKTSFQNKILVPGYINRDFSSESFIEGFAEEISNNRRVILMASQEDEVGYAIPGKGHVFTNYLIKSIGVGFGDLNNNGLISAEEAFNYTQYKIGFSQYTSQNPKIYDDYNGELDITDTNYKLDFFDDCESGVKWTTIDHTGGIGGNLWHLSEKDFGSPTRCWYLGDENTTRYNNNMNNSLLSSNIELGEKPVLIFISKDLCEFLDLLWLDISIDNWNTYNTKKIVSPNYWYPHEISLYSYTNTHENFSGKTIQMRFRVESDESIPFDLYSGNGYFMIDDLQIYSERMVR